LCGSPWERKVLEQKNRIRDRKWGQKSANTSMGREETPEYKGSKGGDRPEMLDQKQRVGSWTKRDKKKRKKGTT